jgi:DNA-binding winged helix-turn-helix (wHTH) protein
MGRRAEAGVRGLSNLHTNWYTFAATGRYLMRVCEAAPCCPCWAYRFGPFDLDIVRRQLWRRGRRVRLAPKAFAILQFLVARWPAIVERGELLRTVWPDTSVSEASLMAQIACLRRVLGADVILTWPGQGYQLGLPVRAAAESGGQSNWLIVLDPIHARAEAEAALARALRDALTAQLLALPGVILQYGRRGQRNGRPRGQQYRLQGSVFRKEAGWRIWLSLLGRGGRVAWSGSFDEQEDNLVALADRVAAVVRDRLARGLGGFHPQRLSPVPGVTNSPALPGRQ